jgi:predicted transcriptional regulator
MEVNETLISSIGFKQYKVDPIEISEITLPPKLMMMMLDWKDTYKSVFETLMMLTNGGQYGILITGPELHELAKVSVPAVFIAIRFLTEDGWITKEKNNTTGNPNIYFVKTEKIRELAGDMSV